MFGIRLFFNHKLVKPVSIGDVIKMGLHDFDEFEGLTLEPSAFQVFHVGNSTFINFFDKAKFLCFTLPPTQYHSFLRN